MVVHMDLSEAIAELGGEASFVVAEEGNECLVAWEFQIGGDLLHVFFGIAKQIFCLFTKKPIDQSTGAYTKAFLADAAQVVGGVSEALCRSLYAQGSIGIDSDPLIDLFRRGIESGLMLRREAAKLREDMQKNGIDQIIGNGRQIMAMEQLLQKRYVFKAFKESGGKGKGDARRQGKMKPVEADVGGVGTSLMENVGL